MAIILALNSQGLRFAVEGEQKTLPSCPAP